MVRIIFISLLLISCSPSKRLDTTRTNSTLLLKEECKKDKNSSRSFCKFTNKNGQVTCAGFDRGFDSRMGFAVSCDFYEGI